MHLQRITIGKDDSLVAAVDPLVDFADLNGVFAQCYGHSDTKPVRDVCGRVFDETARLRTLANQALFKSKYTYDQFRVKGLERLCTTDAGRMSIIPENWFQYVFNKTDNSILSGGPDVEALIDQNECIVFQGVTTTKCIGVSIADIRRRFSGKTLILPMDTVGSRLQRKGDELLLFSGFSKAHNVHTIDRMQDITFS